ALKHAGEKKQAEELAAKLAGTPLVFTLRAGEKDRLFGSVTPTDIAARLAEAGFEIDRKKIVIEEAIKKLGAFTVKVRLHHDVTASLKVEVHKEEVAEEKKEEAKEEATK
ncbi:MAG: 50S ribosomal protein L9, partial [bacterium]